MIWVHSHKQLISKLDDPSRKVSLYEENFFVANQCFTWENCLWLQKEGEVKIVTETLKNEKHCDSLSLTLNEW